MACGCSILSPGAGVQGCKRICTLTSRTYSSALSPLPSRPTAESESDQKFGWVTPKLSHYGHFTQRLAASQSNAILADVCVRWVRDLSVSCAPLFSAMLMRRVYFCQSDPCLWRVKFTSEWIEMPVFIDNLLHILMMHLICFWLCLHTCAVTVFLCVCSLREEKSERKAPPALCDHRGRVF